MKGQKPQLDKEFERQTTQVQQRTYFFFFFAYEPRLIISPGCRELASQVTELLQIVVEELRRKKMYQKTMDSKEN